MTSRGDTAPDDRDRARVRVLLGREPQGEFEVIVRGDDGDPVVLRNAPLLDDGTPMPTRYWLVGPAEVQRISRLEATGAIDRAESEIDAALIADAHRRYATERDAAIPDDHEGPRPSGGVGGTRVGIKCLHAHWAWKLAGGNDPVGDWITERFERTAVRIGETSTTIEFTADGHRVSHDMPWGAGNLTDRWLTEHDPPRPEALTNALGSIDDHLDDIVRLHAGFADSGSVVCSGTAARVLAQVEFGAEPAPSDLPLERAAAEEIFRMVATEPAADRAFNPGLPSDHVDRIVATACIVLAVMRRLDLDVVALG